MMKKTGFSMMELMISIAIVAILAAIAIPSYLSYIKSSRRSDALQTLLSIQLQQEKYRLNHNTYGTLAEVWAGDTTSDGGYYTIGISGVSASGYTITATATGDQVGDKQNGVTCSPLSLVNTNGVITKTPTACWAN